jgi:NAD-dependent deacetylase
MVTSITTAADILRRARYAVALVGAGISVESGIRPFRGKGGLWTEKGEPPMDGYQRFIADPAKHWQEMLARRASGDEFSQALSAAKPNAGHNALAELELMGVLKHQITQNIDNLHFEAGSVAVSEIHGNRTKVRCIDCESRWPWAEFDATELPPRCPHCRGVVKSDTVMFGEGIPRKVLAECYKQAGQADCMIIAGTSAAVTPAAWFPGLVLENGGALIEVNTEPTAFTPHAAAVLRGASGELLPRLVSALRAATSQNPEART